MPVSPDQFQRRVHVRLPFADRYLDAGPNDKRFRRELRTAFANPLCTVPIPKRGQLPGREGKPPTAARAGRSLQPRGTGAETSPGA